MANDIYASASIEYDFSPGSIENVSIDRRKNIRQRKTSGNFNLYLFCTAALFSLYDIVSTVMSVRAVGYSYEGNTILREIIRSAGITGFVGVKLGATLFALYAVYYVVEHRNDFGWRNANGFYSVYIGAIASSLFAATSNLSVVYTGSSFYFHGLNSLQISLLLLFTVPLGGFIIDAAAARKEPRVQSSLRRGITTRSGSVLIICANYLKPFRHTGRDATKK